MRVDYGEVRETSQQDRKDKGGEKKERDTESQTWHRVKGTESVLVSRCEMQRSTTETNIIHNC